jgi:hypothetical protein
MFEEMYNFLALSENLFTGGMPNEEQLKDAAQRGVEVVINLAPHEVSNALPGENPDRGGSGPVHGRDG